MAPSTEGQSGHLSPGDTGPSPDAVRLREGILARPGARRLWEEYAAWLAAQGFTAASAEVLIASGHLGKKGVW